MNITGYQAALVGVIMMILRHFRIGISENEIIAVLSGLIAVGGIVWEWYRGWKNGTLTPLGGRKI